MQAMLTVVAAVSVRPAEQVQASQDRDGDDDPGHGYLPRLPPPGFSWPRRPLPPELSSQRPDGEP